MKLFSSKRRKGAMVALIVLLLFLLHPGASRLKSRIIFAISAAVGRPVDIASVHLRVLPRPGFDLQNLVVYDDPAFGAEPMLRASDVTADLRLMSLLRGRLEIARLDLTEPSLNLVHGANGRWNLEALLERTAHTPLAPTGKAKSEPRPGFPYIEGTSARINFKSGQEKKPYALTNADFSLWQDSENTWGVRLKAQPFRTDLNLSDMGSLVVSGTWQRAGALRDTPLQFTMEWSRAQLGQITKFITGRDRGWRGGAQVDVTLTGTPAKLQIASNASIEDFRRYDIESSQPVRLAGQCASQYSSTDHAFHELVCGAPVGNGMITLKGEMGLPGSHAYDFVLSAESVPANALMQLARRAKKNLPDDLIADGSVQGRLAIEESTATGAELRLDGRGEITELRLNSAGNKTEIGPETVPFLIRAGDSDGRMALRQALRKSAVGMRLPESAYLEFGPLTLASGRAGGAAVRGWISRVGYDISVTGESEISKALRVTRMFGVPALQTTAEGAAQLDLQIMGSWAAQGSGSASGFSGPQVTGNAKLKNVHVTVRGTGGPVEISSADLQLLPEKARVEKLNAKAAGASWNGSLEMPRGCGTPGACQVHFNLNANQIAFGELREWASPPPAKRPWYKVLAADPQAGQSMLASLRASGRVTADHLQMQNLAATHVSANVSLDGGKVRVSELSADVVGGKHDGEWQADFSTKPAVCSGSGTLTGISLARLASAMKDGWISGTANASYELKGSCPADFWESAEGTLQFNVWDGSLPHISLADDAGSLKVIRMSGDARVQGGKLEMKDARLDSVEGKFLVNGTASLKRELDLKLTRASGSGATAGYTITGTVAEPRVIRTGGPVTQARLKTEPAK